MRGRLYIHTGKAFGAIRVIQLIHGVLPSMYILEPPEVVQYSGNVEIRFVFAVFSRRLVVQAGV